MSYTDWCEDCQEITPLTDDGVSGKACAECGHQNTLQTEAAQYATTVTYAGGEFTLDDEALAAFRGPPEDKPEAKWLDYVRRRFYGMAKDVFHNNRSALAFEYLNTGRLPFYERCMQIYGKWRYWEQDPANQAYSYRRTKDAVRLNYQLAACIELCVHESNLAVMQKELVGEEIFCSEAYRTVSALAVRSPMPLELMDKLHKDPARLRNSFDQIAAIANVDASPFMRVLRDVAYVRQHIRDLATSDQGLYKAFSGDEPMFVANGKREKMEQKFLARCRELSDSDWLRVLRYAYHLAHLTEYNDTFNELSSHILAIAVVIWAVQAVCGFVMPQHRAVSTGIAVIWGEGSTGAEKGYTLLRQTLIVWAADFDACDIPNPVVVQPHRSSVIGDGLTGYGGDSRRGIPDYDIAIAAVPVIVKNWRKLAEYRKANVTEMTYLKALEVCRRAFAKASNEYYGQTRVPVGEGSIRRIREPANVIPSRSPLVIPSPNSRAPKAVYEFLSAWRKANLPKRRSLGYLMQLKLSQRDIDSGTVGAWIDQQRWRWCPVEAWMRTLSKAEHLPLSLLPRDLESLKRDFEHAEQLAQDRAEEAGPFADEFWMSERPREVAVGVLDTETQHGGESGSYTPEASGGLLGLSGMDTQRPVLYAGCSTPTESVTHDTPASLLGLSGVEARHAGFSSLSQSNKRKAEGNEDTQDPKRARCASNTPHPPMVVISPPPAYAVLPIAEQLAFIGKRARSPLQQRHSPSASLGTAPPSPRRILPRPMPVVLEPANDLARSPSLGTSPAFLSPSTSTSPSPAPDPVPHTPPSSAGVIADMYVAYHQSLREWTLQLPPLPPLTTQPTRPQLNEIATRARVFKIQSEHYLREARKALPPVTKKKLAAETPTMIKAREHRLVVAMLHHRDTILKYEYMKQLAPGGRSDTFEAYRRVAWWCIDNGYDYKRLAHLEAEKRYRDEEMRIDISRGMTPAEALRDTGVCVQGTPLAERAVWDLPAYGKIPAPGAAVIDAAKDRGAHTLALAQQAVKHILYAAPKLVRGASTNE